MTTNVLFLDTEFNEDGGELISLALAGFGFEWYEVLPCAAPRPWVAKHVMPVLNRKPITMPQFQASLQGALCALGPAHIVADWPEDIAYFCRALITGPGQRIETPRLSFQIVRDLPDTACTSRVPHNALEDARALRAAYVAARERGGFYAEQLQGV